nr:hypothetical protein [uncultured Duganella sp.]
MAEAAQAPATDTQAGQRSPQAMMPQQEAAAMPDATRDYSAAQRRRREMADNSAAVAQLKARAGMMAAAPSRAAAPVQREVLVDRKGTAAAPGGMSQFVKSFDEAVYKAYQYVLHVPGMGKYKDMDSGHIARWLELWQTYERTRVPDPMMAATFGYAVETLATLVYMPPAPDGCHLELQGGRGNTRPDVVLKRGTTDIGWLDITTKAMGGHIWDKAGWDASRLYLVEIGYPSMELAHFAPTANYDDNVDETAFRKRNYWMSQQQKVRRVVWRALGSTEFPAPRRQAWSPTLEQSRRSEAIAKISRYFNVQLDEDTAASALYAMGRNPKSYGFSNSCSRARGESFLMQYDPHLPVLEIPEDGIPHMVGWSEEAIASLDDIPENAFDDTEEAGGAQEAEQMALDVSGPGVLSFEGSFDTLAPFVRPRLVEQVGAFLLQNDLTIVMEISGELNFTFAAAPSASFADTLNQFIRQQVSETRDERQQKWPNRIGKIVKPKRYRIRMKLFRARERGVELAGDQPQAMLEAPPGLRGLFGS